DRFVAARAKDQAIERALVRFSRRELREATSIGDTQRRLHLDRLVLLEYVLTRRDGAGGRFVYELVYDGSGRDGKPFVPGLIDVERLHPAVKTTPTTREVAGVKDEIAGRSRAVRGPVAGGSRGGEIAEDARNSGLSEESSEKTSKTHSKKGNGSESSYARKRVVPLAAAVGAVEDDDAAP
ncbi:MAG: hypothetical protein AAB295_01560, partial [Chloroflexota bacterium]